jgi:DNA-binding response OmpR family regulator
MTGYSHAASETSDPLSGGVVVKPFTPGQLLARVRDILDT